MAAGIKDFLSLCVERGASDLHLTLNAPPILRIHGKLVPQDFSPLDKEQLHKMIYGLLSEEQIQKFEATRELDFSVAFDDLPRFRVNVHQQRGCVEAAFRCISTYIPEPNTLGLPSVIMDLSRRSSGLVLITGPTGSGKTTTLASIINVINEERSSMIMCIEDPVEYVHENKKSIIKQREVFSDTFSFQEALKRCLRQDPDVIVVGEMRDLETISTALTAAETGHLVLATLHTPDAAQTIERIIDVFPPHQQQQVRLQLSASLEGIVSQKLIPHLSGEGRVLATEVLIATPAIRNLIREQSLEQIPTAMQTGSQFGMHTMDMSLRDLYKDKKVSLDDILPQVKNIQEFKQLLD